jgi:hypothetical protein
MSETLSISDPAPLWAASVQKFAGLDQVKQRVVYHRLENYLNAIDRAKATGGDWDKVLADYNSSRHTFDQQMAGRPPGGDWADGASNSLKLFDAAGNLLILAAVPLEQPELAALGGAAKTLSSTGQDIMGLTWVTDSVTGMRSDYSRAFQGSLLEGTENADAAYRRMANECQANPECWQTFQKAEPELAGVLNVAKANPAGAVEAGGPTVYNVYIRQSVQPDGTLRVEVDKLRQSVAKDFAATQQTLTDGFGEIKGALGDINKTLGDLKTGQGTILAWIADQQKQQAARARAEEAALVVDLAWQSAASSIGALSAVARIFDPKLGADIAKFGGAGLQALRAGAQLVKAVDVLSETFSAASALGSAVATGNFIGAVFQLFSLFGDTGPSPDEMILQQIDGLRTQMKDLQADVDARFDRIDTKLNAIYRDVMGELDNIDVKLGRLKDTVDNINSRLTGLIMQLAGLEQQLIAYFQVLNRNALWHDVDDALSRKRRGAPLTIAEYAAVESHFHEWVLPPHGEAWSAVEQPVAGRLTDDEHLAGVLGAPLTGPSNVGAPALTPSDNLSFIKALLIGRGLTEDDGTPLPNPNLPNPMTWAVAASSFAQLRAQYPQYVKLADPTTTAQWWEDIAQGGRAVAAYLRKLLRCHTVFTSLIDDYTAQVTALGHALDSAAADFMKNEAERRGRRIEDPFLDPWQSIDQSVDFNPPWLATMTVPRPGGRTIDAPKNLYTMIPPVFLNADWLTHGQKGKLAAFYDVGFPETDFQHEPEPIERFQFSMGIYIKYDGTLIARKEWTLPGWVDPSQADQLLDKHWNNPGDLRVNVEADHLASDELSDFEQSLADAAAARARDFANGELTTIRTNAYAALAGQSPPEAARLDGARALLDTLISLVFEQVRRGDDLIVALLDGAMPAQGGVRLPDSTDVRFALGQLTGDIGLAGNRGKELATWLTALPVTAIDLLRQRIRGWQDRYVAGTYDEWYMLAERPAALAQTAKILLSLDNLAVNAPAEEDIVATLPIVTQGASGPPARRVQALLRAASIGSTDTTLAIDGEFGPATKKAVQQFQQANGLTASGTVDPPTWHKLLGM